MTYVILALAILGSQSSAAAPAIQDFKTTRGFTFHSSCLELGLAHYSLQEVKQSLEDYSEKAYQAVVQNCSSKYTELEMYTKQWAKKFSQATLFCTEKTSDEINAGAVALGSTSDLKQFMGKSIIKQYGTKIRFLPAARSKHPLIVMPKDYFLNALDHHSYGSYSLDTLIHEVFHLTSANNQSSHRHNRAEKMSGRCGEENSFLDDRIYVISNLCSGYTSHTDLELGFDEDTSLEAAMKLRIAIHGSKVACEKTFQKTNLRESLYTPSKGLSKKQSESLCERFSNSSQ